MTFRNVSRDAWARHFAELDRLNYSRTRNAERGNIKTWGSSRNNERLDVFIRNINGRRVPIYSIASNRDTGNFRRAVEYLPHSMYPIHIPLLSDEPNLAGDYEPTPFLNNIHNLITNPHGDHTNLANFIDSLLENHPEHENRIELYMDTITNTIRNPDSFLHNLQHITLADTIKLCWIASMATIRNAGF